MCTSSICDPLLHIISTNFTLLGSVVYLKMLDYIIWLDYNSKQNISEILGLKYLFVFRVFCVAVKCLYFILFGTIFAAWLQIGSVAEIQNYRLDATGVY
ncbi:hypothetical protein ACJX0J_036639, partial [Zea mays]